MKIQCSRCEKIFYEDNIILMNIGGRGSFPKMYALCLDCYEHRKKVEQENKTKPWLKRLMEW